MQFANWEVIIEGYCNVREKNWVFGRLLNNVLHLFDNIDTLILDCESIGDKVWYIEVEYKLVAGFVINRIPYKSLYLLKLSIQMFLCLKSTTNSIIISLFRWSIRETANCWVLGIVCKLDVKRFWKQRFRINGGVTEVRSYSDARLIECESTHLLEPERDAKAILRKTCQILCHTFPVF